MSKEKKRNSSEILSGSDWSFSNKNTYLNPETFTNVDIRDFSKLPEAMRTLISGIATVVKPNWRLASVLTKRIDDRIILICTNPTKTNLSNIQPQVANFVLEEVLDKKILYNRLYKDIISQYLTKTNYVGIAHAHYNRIKEEKRQGILPFKKEHLIFQSGVAFLDIALATIDEAIINQNSVNSSGQAIRNQNYPNNNRSIEELVSLKVDNPKKLFPD